eukprot:Sspe_Gene.46392::Locus_23173_Transcript_1_1_Confidence_1.000_Length_2953::g.46392::m.46392
MAPAAAYDLLVEDDRIRLKQREQARKRKKAIKKYLREQEQRVILGGHDVTGTRVTEDTPLKPAVEEQKRKKKKKKADGVEEEVEEAQPDAATRSPGKANGVKPLEAIVCTSPLMMPLPPQQTTPSRRQGVGLLSPSRKKPQPSNILKRSGQILGRGAFGTVYMGLDTATGELIAIKEIIFKDATEEVKRQIAGVVKEISLMKRLVHPNIVQYYGADRQDVKLQIYMEYVPGGSLRSILDNFGRLTQSVVAKYIRQMLQGLEFLHAESVAHMDIKGDNALLGVTGEVKLADFGASEMIDDLSNKVAGTPYFMAPEVVKGIGHTVSADIWSVGITVIELTTGVPPLSDIKDPFAVMFRIARSCDPPPIPDFFAPNTAEFVRMCLQVDPLRRPTASQLLTVPYVEQAYEDEPQEGNASLPQLKPPQQKATNHVPGGVGQARPAWGSMKSMAGQRSIAGASTGSRMTDMNPMQSVGSERPRSPGQPSIRRSSQGCGNTDEVKRFVRAEGAKAVNNDVSDIDYLERLHQQLTKGIITLFEYQTKKAQLLGSSKGVLEPCGE